MTIVFFFPKAIRASRQKTLQLDRLEREGFEIVIIDASSYYDKYNNLPSARIHDNTILLQGRNEILNFKKSLTIFPVLWVIADAYLNDSSSLLSQIIRKKDFVLSYSNKTFAPIRKKNIALRSFLEKTIRFLDKILPIHMCKIYYSSRYNQIIPNYFLGSTQFLIPIKILLTVKKGNRITVHADDINEVIELSKDENLMDGILDNEKKTGVFLDHAIPFQHLISPGISNDFFPVKYKEQYFDNLTRTLNALKIRYSLDEVVIALHPSAMHFKEEIDTYLNNFKTVLWATTALIKNSDIVFGHFSTALGYAIYYQKPTILLTDNCLSTKKTWNEAFRYFNQELGMEVVKMDYHISENREIVPQIDKRKYMLYSEKYLKDNRIMENSYFYAIKKIFLDQKELK